MFERQLKVLPDAVLGTMKQLGQKAAKKRVNVLEQDDDDRTYRGSVATGRKSVARGLGKYLQVYLDADEFTIECPCFYHEEMGLPEWFHTSGIMKAAICHLFTA